MPLKTSSDDPLQLNLTPMIDVVFLLVIFFMTATQFAQVERAIEIELPTVGAEGATAATPDQPSVITVLADGRLELNSKPIEPDELDARLRDAAIDNPDHSVLIHGDARCNFQHIASTLASCRAAGIADVGVSVETVADRGSVVR
ncbi:ExbD/TolR family protein [Botrimarina hoheduenensis]|uniref:Biopolymer transport protein ExbD n=1 Tax=Botrimarina hoheduenensis TaxID=2528000 RepID=A0A5C5W8F9_9BACT|nr:biopolymer transporter ExbD [Botrimarina hoheduenensis]TWT47178.1 Biopolymer transport protein ExbD [Botrimarina hoheduenensis]